MTFRIIALVELGEKYAVMVCLLNVIIIQVLQVNDNSEQTKSLKIFQK